MKELYVSILCITMKVKNDLSNVSKSTMSGALRDDNLLLYTRLKIKHCSSLCQVIHLSNIGTNPNISKNKSQIPHRLRKKTHI